MNTKITPQHQSKPAYIYIRQSTLAQVRHNQESTERQYALRDKALALGWPETAIRVLDRDLGQSGAQMTGREDFKTLVADVSMGNVGAVFALEVSRLARSNLDWHRLLELCALTHTLVIDADGCYDAGDFNDGLILGLKGTMAQAELHFLRGRLQGGKLNKAKKGELRFPLPVGLCFDDDGRIVLDPDDEVRGAVQLAFRLFQETGSAYAVVKRFAEDGLRFPKRAYGGAWAGRLIWGRLSHERVLGLIRNPSYAGVYVFGRYQYRQRITPQGEVHKHVQPVPKAEWRVHLPNHHDGYITLEEFERNQGTPGAQQDQRRRYRAQRRGARRSGTASRDADMRPLWPGADRAVPESRWPLSAVPVQQASPRGSGDHRLHEHAQQSARQRDWRGSTHRATTCRTRARAHCPERTRAARSRPHASVAHAYRTSRV